ncbi:MAG: DUF3572 domain-containing protein [Proteobacteria bacterium]|nr:DUF3572 domain-containing protein [Pseudomonadota bacterium]
MQREQAETIALQALSFLAKDDELLGQFLTKTGLTPQELKQRVREPDLLGGVLDAILEDDTILLAFCNVTSLSPETIIKARIALPGGFVLD